jgi:predicted aminopeptidase
MFFRSFITPKRRRWLFLAALALIAIGLSGCQTFTFYRQALTGQYELFTHQKPIETLVNDPKTPARLRSQLQLVSELRTFAQKELRLEVDGHYRKYVDVQRPFVVWNVEAAPEFSMAPKGWWYPLVGKLEYRGYFSEKGAQGYSAKLKKQHYDVYIGGATAYSTLGWFKDPVLNTFVFEPEPDLAETLFHELGHQRVFARGDTDFNEAFATTVGEEGARRWLASKTNSVAAQDYAAERRRTRDFVHMIAVARGKLEALYGDVRQPDGKLKPAKNRPALSDVELRAQKGAILEALRHDYDQAKEDWHKPGEYDVWFSRELNNAKLNSVAAYYDLVPGFERLLELNQGDLEKFYRAAEALSKKPKKERQQWLRGLASLDSQSRVVSDK